MIIGSVGDPHIHLYNDRNDRKLTSRFNYKHCVCAYPGTKYYLLPRYWGRLPLGARVISIILSRCAGLQFWQLPIQHGLLLASSSFLFYFWVYEILNLTQLFSRTFPRHRGAYHSGCQRIKLDKYKETTRKQQCQFVKERLLEGSCVPGF